MKYLVAAAALAVLATPALAQTAVGVGVAKSDSTAISGSRATAIGGGQANARGGTGVGIGTGGNPTASINIAGAPATSHSTIENTGTSTVKNVPSVFAPGLAAAGLETCLGSVSGGGSFVGTGFSFGSTIPDPGCAARLDARTLWSMGLKKAAIARLCLGSDIRAAMPEICGQYLPVQPGYVAPAVIAPAGYYYSEGTYRGGPIMLTDGKTGKERLCNNYDEPRHRCRAWDGETHVVMHSKPKAAVQVAASPQKKEAN